MQIRIANVTDTSQIKELRRYGFGNPAHVLAWNFEKNYNHNNTMVVENNNKILSNLSMKPYNLHLYGEPVSTCYLHGFSTDIAYRKQGYMKNLINKSIQHLYESENVLALLVPFSYRMAEQYGFRTVYQYQQYDLNIRDIPSYKLKGKIERVLPSGMTIHQLNTVYSEFTQDKNAYVLRNQEDWTLILENFIQNFGGIVSIIYDENDQPTGYIFYQLHNNQMSVYELAYKDRQSYESLLAYIKNHSPQIEQIQLKMPINDLLYTSICDNRNAVSVRPFAMARITNVRKALALLCKSFNNSITIQIIDHLIEENNGTYAIIQNEISRTESAPDVITDIGTLTQLFTGFLSVNEAQRLNLISGNSKLLEGLFKKKYNFINMLLGE